MPDWLHKADLQDSAAREEAPRRLSRAEKRALGQPLLLDAEFREVEAAPPPVDWVNRTEPGRSAKTLISLRVDPEVLDFFKAQGPGYQTRINAVLQAYMLAKKDLNRP